MNSFKTTRFWKVFLITLIINIFVTSIVYLLLPSQIPSKIVNGKIVGYTSSYFVFYAVAFQILFLFIGTLSYYTSPAYKWYPGYYFFKKTNIRILEFVYNTKIDEKKYFDFLIEVIPSTILVGSSAIILLPIISVFLFIPDYFPFIFIGFLIFIIILSLFLSRRYYHYLNKTKVQ